MKVKRYFVLIVVLLLVTTILGGQTKLNHFKVYSAKCKIKQFSVSLQDQFSKEQKRAIVRGIPYFANPVNKNGEGIPNPNAHLTWYTINIDEPLIKRVVVIENQFGKQKLILGKALYLLVPTEKIEPNSLFPCEFNHFICYEVLEGDFKTDVKLKDQFNESSILFFVGKPRYFCNPVSKNMGKIYDPNYHLVCYDIVSPAEGLISRTINIKNQFGDNRLTLQKGTLLCVPSQKIEWSVIK